MTNSEAIKVLKDLRAFDDDCEEDCKAIDIAISSLEENDKLKAEIEQLKSELEQSVKLPKKLDKGTICYIYANSVYTVPIDNIGKVIKLRGIRCFYGNYEEAEKHLKGKAEE